MQDLEQELIECVRRERGCSVEVLRYLRAVDYKASGYSSLFSYCTKRLGYSEPEAQVRVRAVRLIIALPEVEGYLRKGELSLSVAALVQGVVRREKLGSKQARELLKQVKGTSKREADEKLAALYPNMPKPERRIPLNAEEVELRFTVKKEEMALVDRLLDRRAHTNFERSLGRLFIDLARGALAKLEKNHTQDALPRGPSKVNSRYIKAAVKRKIWKRDEGRCQFIGKNGHRCQETHGLQLDHIQPLALGGPTTEENLRLLCGAHNRWRSRRV